MFRGVSKQCKQLAILITALAVESIPLDMKLKVQPDSEQWSQSICLKDGAH